MPDCLDPPWKEMIRNDTSNKQIPGCSPLLLLLLLLLYVQGLAGAEIRGIVRLEHTGLFGDAHAAPESGPLSVSIFPLHGVRPPAGTSRLRADMKLRFVCTCAAGACAPRDLLAASACQAHKSERTRMRALV